MPLGQGCWPMVCIESLLHWLRCCNWFRSIQLLGLEAIFKTSAAARFPALSSVLRLRARVTCMVTGSHHLRAYQLRPWDLPEHIFMSWGKGAAPLQWGHLPFTGWVEDMFRQLLWEQLLSCNSAAQHIDGDLFVKSCHLWNSSLGLR